jgi:hypothetical protein
MHGDLWRRPGGSGLFIFPAIIPGHRGDCGTDCRNLKFISASGDFAFKALLGRAPVLSIFTGISEIIKYRYGIKRY